jgi:glycosyltransferase involved in cell wall biosynthesis
VSPSPTRSAEKGLGDMSNVRRVVAAAALVAAARAGLARYNRAALSAVCVVAARSDPEPGPITVCVPARNEADRLPDLIADLRAQRGIPDLRVLILDDDSTDGTAEVATAAIGRDPRFEMHHGTGDPPHGWVGKQAACAHLAELADARTGTLVFLDADVRLAPDALAVAARARRATGAALLSPWPRQVAESLPERLMQPLLCWSWAGTLPMPLANASTRPSTAVACGQFLVFDPSGYRAIGGHAAVAASATEDLALARALRRSGAHTVALPAGDLASCRMYRGAAELDAGYTRWLWSAYGGVPGSIAVGSILAFVDLLPAIAALCGRGRVRAYGVLGYSAAVSSRVLARSMETNSAPNPAETLAALAHPVAIAGYLLLTIRSHRAHRHGTASWRGRPLISPGTSATPRRGVPKPGSATRPR